MLRNPALYAAYNGLPKSNAEDVLAEYSSAIKWKEIGDRIVDVGCGDGSVTCEVLNKYLPSNYVSLVGLDISEEAIQYANNKYGTNDSRLQFVVHDIQKELPGKFKGSFDKVFSFYLFHFVPDHGAAFRNLYQLLSEDGTCLVTFMARAFIFEIYSIMSRAEKWKSWLANVDQYISPYQFSQKPEEEIEKIMKNAGFNQVEVKIQRKTYESESAQYVKQILKALNTFKLPETQIDDFVADFIQLGLESGELLLNRDKNGSAGIIHAHDLVIAVAKK